MRQLFCLCKAWQTARETKYKFCNILPSRFTVSVWQYKFRIFAPAAEFIVSPSSLAWGAGTTTLFRSQLYPLGQDYESGDRVAIPLLGLDPYSKICRTLPVKDHALAPATDLLLLGLYVVAIGFTHPLLTARIGTLCCTERKKTKRDKELTYLPAV
jgi:hypothetical protein